MSVDVDVRPMLVDQIRREDDPTKVADLLLDPRAGVVQEALNRYERGNAFPTTERELIADYVNQAIRRRVERVTFGKDDGDPFAWCDSFARACVRGGVKEVQRARARRANVQLHSEGATAGLIEFVGISAEDAFLESRRFRDVDQAGAVIDQATGRHERLEVIATQLRGIWGLPALHTQDRQTRRRVHRILEREDAIELIRASLEIHRGIVSGNAGDRSAVPEVMLDLWVEWTAEHVSDLLAKEDHMVLAVVRGSIVFPPPPSKQTRVSIRRELKMLSPSPAWQKLVMRLEEAWAAEFFTARDPAHRGRDPRSEKEAEAMRAYTASSWPALALEAASFEGHPLGSGVCDETTVAAEISTIWRNVLTPEA